MKKIIIVIVLGLLCLSVAHDVCASAAGKDIYDIMEFGAIGDGYTDNATAINSAIESCSAGGGGTVVVPSGEFLTGTIHLKSGVRLYLEDGAIIKGHMDPDVYKSYSPTNDMSRYDSGDGTVNSNNSKDLRWNRALILGVGLSDVSIEGSGVIDGRHLYDPLGEEHMRGPHTILIAESESIILSGITIINSANYAFMSYGIEDARFIGLTIKEGWDGIHIRGGKDVVINDCEFYTGDDAIAGGYWENMSISRCQINSSCNGIRMIMPCEGLEISECRFYGPGMYPHRTSGPARRTNMLTAVLLQPGGWGNAYGDIENIHIHDLEIDNVATPVMLVLNEGNDGKNILIEGISARNVYKSAISIESWRGGVYENAEFRNMNISFKGHDDPSLSSLNVGQPPADSRLLPCWALYARNVRQLKMSDIEFCLDGTDFRPALLFDNIGEAVLKDVVYHKSNNKDSVMYFNSGKVTEIHTR